MATAGHAMTGRMDMSGRQAAEGLAEIAVTVASDPAVWLSGPRTRAETEGWVAGTLGTLRADWALERGSAQEAYVSDVLGAFARADLGSTFRLLRWRALAEPPVAARLDLLAGDQGVDPLLAFPADLPWYDHRALVETLDARLGIRRASRMYVADGVRTVVRLHRQVGGVDVIVSVAGYTLQVTAAVLGDLELLLGQVVIEPSVPETRARDEEHIR